MVQHILDGLLEALDPELGRQVPGSWGKLVPVEAAEFPAPYRDLLVHDRDMTRTLEQFLGARLELETLARRRVGDQLFRQVLLLEREPRRRVAEAGAIRIELDSMPDRARRDVLAEKLPLGGILHACGVEHHGKPRAFFACTPMPELAHLLEAPQATRFYGRLSRLHRNDDGRLLAEAVEILPSLAERGPGEPKRLE